MTGSCIFKVPARFKSFKALWGDIQNVQEYGIVIASRGTVSVFANDKLDQKQECNSLSFANISSQSITMCNFYSNELVPLLIPQIITIPW